jgi:hypothetical protein
MGDTPFYETPEEMQEKITEYFQSLIKIDKDGKEYTDHPTITGLTYFLGFADRKSFYNYEVKEKFSHTVKRSRLFIESAYESQLFKNNVAGAIFALKNFGWTDKQEIEHSGKIEPINIIINGEVKNAENIE